MEEDNPNFVNVRRPKIIVYRLAFGLEEDLFVLSLSGYLPPNGLTAIEVRQAVIGYGNLG